MMIDLSPTAELVLNRLREEPDRERFDTGVFGGMFRPEHVDLLDAAYKELEDAGLIERTGNITRFFGTPKRLYRLSERGRSPAGSRS